jgi:hypothetical protein
VVACDGPLDGPRLGPREFVDEREGTREFEPREALAAVPLEFVGSQSIVVGNDERADQLTPLVVGEAHDDDVGDHRM